MGQKEGWGSEEEWKKGWSEKGKEVEGGRMKGGREGRRDGRREGRRK